MLSGQLMTAMNVVWVTEWLPIGEKLLTQFTMCFLGISTKFSISFFPSRFSDREFCADCAIP